MRISIRPPWARRASRGVLLALATVLLVAGLASCGEGDDGAADAVTTQAPATSPEAAPPDTTTGPSPEATPEPAAAPPGLEVVARDLSSAVAAVTRSGDGRLYVVEQGGLIQVVDATGTRPDPFLDLSDEISAGGEQGLLGLAFHPDHQTNRLLYVNHTGTDGTTRVVEFQTEPGGERVDTATARELLSVEQPFGNHNGGGLAFGSDGFLYIGLGDGGSGGDPLDAGQRTDTLLGKMLRIDVDARDGALPYGIPESNPFVGGSHPEIWALGLRNPWRFSFDPADGSLWIGDVGQNAIEEINRLPSGEAGLNLGWARFEGTARFSDGELPSHHLPVAEYDHGLGCSVTGGHVYRGDAVPAIRDRYIYGDFCSGRVWSLDADNPTTAEPVEILGEARSELENRLTSFGRDAEGEILVVGSSTVYRIAATTSEGEDG